MSSNVLIFSLWLILLFLCLCMCTLFKNICLPSSFFYCCSSTVVSIFPPLLSLTSSTPTCHTQSSRFWRYSPMLSLSWLTYCYSFDVTFVSHWNCFFCVWCKVQIWHLFYFSLMISNLLSIVLWKDWSFFTAL